MPIASDRPETGVRIKIERDPARAEAPYAYAGAAHVPEASFPVAVVVDGAGQVTVTVEPASDGTRPPPDLAEKVRLLVRTTYRQAQADGAAPAWRIVRWRGEK